VVTKRRVYQRVQISGQFERPWLPRAFGVAECAERTEPFMSLEENKLIVRRFLEALDQQNFDALKEHPGLYQTVVRQPIIRAAFPDLQTTVEHQVAEGDTVATRATMRGTHRGPLFGVAPTNQLLTWTVLLMNKIVDGKIVLHHANADWIGVLVKLGVVAAPGGEIPRPSTVPKP
jgi:predicted ester cyclase